MLALVLLLVPQDGQVEAGREPHSALRIEVSGALDLHYLERGGEINAAGGALNGVAPPVTRSTNAWSGRVSLRADARLRDSVTGVVEVENRSFDEGLNRPFSSDPETDTLDLKQAYIDVAEFLDPKLGLRIGIQDLAIRNRPHDEPFFLDLGRSEGFFEGFAPSGHIRDTADRDVQEATGITASWALHEVLLVRAAALVYSENGPASSDESVYLLTANAAIPDSLALWVLGVLVSGGDPDLGGVWTLGAGVNGYLFEDRPLEVFAEGYLQRGELTDAVSKRAWAGNAGLRWLAGFADNKAWIEAAVSFRSGNRSVTDGRDEAFQSYENENRFLIVQSAEFGLDLDTNLRAVRAAAGAGPFEIVEGKPLRLQVDVAQFTADQRLRDAAGAVLARGEDDWGLEVDAGLSWSFNASLLFTLKGAWLLGSELFNELTGDDHSALGLFGASLRF